MAENRIPQGSLHKACRQRLNPSERDLISLLRYLDVLALQDGRLKIRCKGNAFLN